MSWRLLHFGGRPGFLPTGSSGASAAHCPSVRSPRPTTGAVEVGIVSTRSLCGCGFSSSLTQPPEASCLCQQPATCRNAQAKTDPGVHTRLLKHALVSFAVNPFTKSSELGEDLLGGLGPDERLRLGVPVFD